MRHLATRSNRCGIFLGQSDEGIEPEGNCVELIRTLKCDDLIVLSSPLKRCLETAEQALGPIHSEVNAYSPLIEHRLAERGLGPLEGLSKREFYASTGYSADELKRNPALLDQYGAETYSEFKARVEDFFEDFEERLRSPVLSWLLIGHLHVFEILLTISGKPLCPIPHGGVIMLYE